MDNGTAARPPAFGRFVARAGEGRNSVPRIILGSLIVVVVWFSGTFAIIAAAAYVSMMGMLPELTGAFASDPLKGMSETRFGMALSIFTLVAIWPGVWITVRLLHKRRLHTLFGASGWLAWGDFRRAALVTLAVVVVISLVNMAYEPTVERSSLALSTWFMLVPVMAVILLLQTSAEEIFFRGYLLQTLAHRFRSPWIWAVAPTLVFAVAHLSPGAQPWMGVLIIFAIALFALGAVALVWATGNLGAAMGMHFANNLVALLFLTNGNDAGTLALFIMPPVDHASWTIGDALVGGVQQIVFVGAVLALLLSRRSPVRLHGAAVEHEATAVASAAE